jgi:hypothetical protein
MKLQEEQLQFLVCVCVSLELESEIRTRGLVKSAVVCALTVAQYQFYSVVVRSLLH